MLPRHMISRAAGITRSLVTYYGPIWRRRRMEAFTGSSFNPVIWRSTSAHTWAIAYASSAGSARV